MPLIVTLINVQFVIYAAISPEILKFETNELIDILRFLNVVFVALPHNIAIILEPYDAKVNLKFSKAKFYIVALLQRPKIDLYYGFVSNYKL